MRSFFKQAYIILFFLQIIGVCFVHADVNNIATSAFQGIESSLFTGKVNYTIPIYKLEDPDFPLEIALRYQTDGFKPFQPSGIYGQDWSLLAGGYITRSEQQFPDEQKTAYQNAMLYEQGMLFSIAEGCMPDKDSVFAMTTYAYDSDCGVSCSYNEFGACYFGDYMPDIFNFSFMGYAGSFIINNQGEATILNGNCVKIDLSDLRDICNRQNFAYTSYTPETTSRISITTDDGYQYIFGGNVDAFEYSTLSTISESYNSQRIPAISKWYLTTIIAPNNRSMSFHYKRSGNLKFFVTDYDWSEQTSLDNSTHLLWSVQKVCLLDSITTSDSIPFSVSFRSSPESQQMYSNSIYNWSSQSLQLDSIVVKCNSKVLKSARLSYMYRAHNMTFGAIKNYYWRYLSSVKISGVGTYSFDYNLIDPAPGNMVSIYLYPNIEITTDSAYKAIVDRWGFWRLTSLQGLLSTISLPTGGLIRFTYGSHQYGQEKRYRTINSQHVEMRTYQFTSNQTIGGARIEKIETFADPTTLVETKRYDYTQKGNAFSSGIYYNIYDISTAVNETKAIVNPYNYGLINSHIGYSYIQQTITHGNTSYKTTYTYDTGHSSYSSNLTFTIHRNNNIENYSDTAELCSGSLTYSPKLIQTGKLLAVEQYNGDVLQKGTYFRYNGISNTATTLPSYQGTSLGCTDTIVCLSTYSAHIARKLFIYPDILEQVVTYEHDSTANNATMTSSISYTYDNKLRKKEAISSDSRGRTYFIRYTYPDEMQIPMPYPLFQLKRTNRIGHPIEVYSGFIENNTEYVTNGIIEDYDNHVSVTNGYYRFFPYLSRTLSLALTEPLTGYQPMTVSNNDIVYDRHYKLDTEYNFDYNNRPIYIKPIGQAATTYTWDGIYLVSKTTGNQTWRYSYIPYVGLQMVTDPRGITTYYNYDAAGRLVEEYQIINGQKQINNVYHYHIKTE